MGDVDPMSAIDVIRRVEVLGGRLLLDNGDPRVRVPAPLPDDLIRDVSEEKVAIMVALGAPLNTVVSEILTDVRPQLPDSLKKLPDDRLLVLINWSIIAAWDETMRRLRPAVAPARSAR